MVGVVGLAGLVHTQAAAASASTTSDSEQSSEAAPSWSHTTIRRGGSLGEQQRQHAGDGWEETGAAGERSLASLPPLRGQQLRPPRYDDATGRGEDGSSSGEDSPGQSIGEEDLGWGEDGSLDDYTIDLGSMIVPQVTLMLLAGHVCSN